MERAKHLSPRNNLWVNFSDYCTSINELNTDVNGSYTSYACTRCGRNANILVCQANEIYSQITV